MIRIWIVAFVDSLEQGMGPSLSTYVTSHFKIHSLTSATSIMSTIIAGLTKLPLAKLIDIWGRSQGYIVMVGSLTLGLILMAVCNNVKLYAAAQIFYWIGHNGTEYVVSVFIADTSRLKNRGLMFAFLTSPFIITSWISGPLATAYLEIKVIDGQEVITGIGWRWAYGTFAILVPIVSLPLFVLFQWNYKKALKTGLMPVEKPDRTFAQSVKYYLIEFDAVGLVLIMVGLTLLLLPFNIYSYQHEKFSSTLISCMIGLGVLLLMAFAIWERFGAKRTFVPFDLLRDRTVLGANLLGAVIFFGFYMWNGMFFSFLQVVCDLSVTEASYVYNIYSIGSCIWSFAAGVLIARTGRFKAQALFFGVPITLLGAGLMINFRQPGVNIGFVILCQILIAFAGGTLVRHLEGHNFHLRCFTDISNSRSSPSKSPSWPPQPTNT
jgi:MFS family permease